MDGHGLYVDTAAMRFLTLATILCLAPWGLNARVLWRTDAPGTLEMVNVLRPDEFSEAAILRLCRAFLAAHQRERFLRYAFATDDQEAYRGLRGRGTTDSTFSSWLYFYRAAHYSGSFAEMLRIGDRIGVRFRFQDGSITERILQGGTPFQIRFQGQDVRLLFITFYWTHGDADAPPKTAEIYLETPLRFNRAQATALTLWLRRETGLQWLVTFIENGWTFAP